MANTPRYIIFHTAAWPGDPSVEDIDRAHRERGFDSVGYHYVIRKDGTVEKGRPEHKMGAHCKDGGMNRMSIGVCFSGHHNEEHWTKPQRLAWLKLARQMIEKYDIHPDHVLGHRETGAAKDCPGIKVNCDLVRGELKSYLQGDMLDDAEPSPAESPADDEPPPVDQKKTLTVPSFFTRLRRSCREILKAHFKISDGGL